jgi:hypothetical protein
MAPAAHHAGVTVIDRYIPLVTAACSTRVARPERATTLPRGSDGSSWARRVRPVLGDHALVGKSPEGSRQRQNGSHARRSAAGRVPAGAWAL